MRWDSSCKLEDACHLGTCAYLDMKLSCNCFEDAEFDADRRYCVKTQPAVVCDEGEVFSNEKGFCITKAVKTIKSKLDGCGLFKANFTEDKL